MLQMPKIHVLIVLGIYIHEYIDRYLVHSQTGFSSLMSDLVSICIIIFIILILIWEQCYFRYHLMQHEQGWLSSQRSHGT